MAEINHVEVDSTKPSWHAGVKLKANQSYLIKPNPNSSYTLDGGSHKQNFHGGAWMDGNLLGIPSDIRLGGLAVLVWHDQPNGAHARPEIISFPPGKDSASTKLGPEGGSMWFIIGDHPGTYSDNSGVLKVDVVAEDGPDQRVASGSQGAMEFTVRVSRTGVVETERYAGFKRQSGTYHHYFWFALLDENEDTLWVLRDPLTLTIGAATDPWGRPSFVSKREYKAIDVPAEHAKSFAKIALYMQETSGGGSLIDQIAKADRTYKKLKEMQVIKDLIVVVAAS